MPDLLNNSTGSSSTPSSSSSAAATATTTGTAATNNSTSTANGEPINGQTSSNLVTSSTIVVNNSTENRSANNRSLQSPNDQKSAIVKTKSMQENLNGIETEEITSGQLIQTGVVTNNDMRSSFMTRLPWGAIKDKYANSNSSSIYEVVGVDRKKPGEYLMHLIVLNFVQLSSKKFEQMINGEKRVSKINLKKSKSRFM
jgi:hypothetical protein